MCKHRIRCTVLIRILCATPKTPSAPSSEQYSLGTVHELPWILPIRTELEAAAFEATLPACSARTRTEMTRPEPLRNEWDLVRECNTSHSRSVTL